MALTRQETYWLFKTKKNLKPHEKTVEGNWLRESEVLQHGIYFTLADESSGTHLWMDCCIGVATNFVDTELDGDRFYVDSHGILVLNTMVQTAVRNNNLLDMPVTTNTDSSFNLTSAMLSHGLASAESNYSEVRNYFLVLCA